MNYLAESDAAHVFEADSYLSFGFTNASDCKIEFEDDVRNDAKDFAGDVGFTTFDNKNVELCTLNSAASGFSSASGMKLQISESALNRAKSVFETVESNDDVIGPNCSTIENVYPKSDGSIAGFTNAKGVKLQISESALSRAKSMFETEFETFENNDDMNGPKCSTIENVYPKCDGSIAGFTKANGVKLQISESALSRAKSMFETEFETFENNDDMNGPKCSTIENVYSKSDGAIVGFTKANGVKLQISEQALNRAKSVFASEFEEDVVNLDDKVVVEDFHNTELFHFQNPTTIHGFSNATGKKLPISESALNRAQSIFAAEDLHLSEVGNDQVDAYELDQPIKKNGRNFALHNSKIDTSTTPVVSEKNRCFKRYRTLPPRRIYDIFEESNGHPNSNQPLETVTNVSCNLDPDRKIVKYKTKFEAPLLSKFKNKNSFSYNASSSSVSANTSITSIEIENSAGSKETCKSFASTSAAISNDLKKSCPSPFSTTSSSKQTGSLDQLLSDEDIDKIAYVEKSVVRISLIALSSQNISCIEALILRIYPIQFIERIANGTCVIRNEKAENVEASKYEQIVQNFIENIMHDVEGRLENQNEATGKPNLVYASSQMIRTCQDASELYDLYLKCADTTKFETILSATQKNDLKAYADRMDERKAASIRDEINALVRSRCAKMKRNVSSVFKIQILDLNGCPKEPKDYATVTIKNPSEEIEYFLKEMTAVRIHDLAPVFNSKLDNNLDTHLNLHTTFKSVFESISDSVTNITTEMIDVLQRRIYPFRDFKCANFRPLFQEVDIVGVVIDVTKGQSCDTVYITDENYEFVLVRIKGGLESFLWTNFAQPGQFVYVSNLKVIESSLKYRVPEVFTNERSIMTCDPKNVEASRTIHAFKEKISNKNGFIIEALSRLKSLLGTPRVAYKASSTSTLIQRLSYSTTPLNKQDQKRYFFDQLLQSDKSYSKFNGINILTSDLKTMGDEPISKATTPKAFRPYKKPRRLLDTV